MYNSTMRTFAGRMFIATLGCVIMSIGINVFTTPWNLYTTGLMGYSQFLRSVLAEDFSVNFSNIDLAGILYYVFSIPIFIITYKSLGRSFFLRTLAFTGGVLADHRLHTRSLRAVLDEQADLRPDRRRMRGRGRRHGNNLRLHRGRT